MKTFLPILFSATLLSVSVLGKDPAPDSLSVKLKTEVLSLDWTQCGGRFRYLFAKDGTYTLQGTLLGGTWNVEEGGDLVLRWSNNWIVDHLKFDASRQQFLHVKGDAFNIRGVASAQLAGG